MESSAVTYHRLVVDGLRYFNSFRIDDIERLDMQEYYMYMEASQLRQEDERLKMHEQAFVNQQAKATKSGGKPVYQKFDDFYGKSHTKNIRKIERVFFPEKFAAEDKAKIERGQQFTRDDFNFLSGKSEKV